MRKLALAVTAFLFISLPAQAHNEDPLPLPVVPSWTVNHWRQQWALAATHSLSLESLGEWRFMRDTYFPGPERRSQPQPQKATPRPLNPTSVTVPPAWGASPNEALYLALIQTYFQPQDVDQAMRVVKCESGFSSTARNSRSSAAGAWQFLRDTWDRMVSPNTGSPSYDAGGPFDPTWATINAAWLWYNVGPSQWTCY